MSPSAEDDRKENGLWDVGLFTYTDDDLKSQIRLMAEVVPGTATTVWLSMRDLNNYGSSKHVGLSQERTLDLIKYLTRVSENWQERNKGQ